ncbi:hypothetical protein DY000_02037241 [Brassica cretica]|uniref:Uncharacterized protein n=1 Tax=Brassica cretica TaxID=69181 RepID=A0ABQ7BHK9_BRACR|nr:hypothetical protein DY000_02037241 [Brassica cretica]
MGMLVERRRCKRGYGGTPNGYGGYAGGDLYPPMAAKEVLVKELMAEDMKVVVVKEVVSRHGSSGGFSGGGSYEDSKEKETRCGDRSTFILFSCGGEAYGGMEFIVVDGCGSGGGERSGSG